MRQIAVTHVTAPPPVTQDALEFANLRSKVPPHDNPRPAASSGRESARVSRRSFHVDLADFRHEDMSVNPMEPAPSRALSDVVARLGADVAMPLTSALARLQVMSSTGRIDRSGLQALRDEIDLARRVGMRGQQIARLAGGLVQQEAERVNLGTLLRGVLAEQAAQSPRQDEVGLRQSLAPVEVVADASLVATVLRAAADWALEHARDAIEWRVEMQPWPAQARLQCRVRHALAEEAPPPDVVASERNSHVASLDTLDWLLLRFSAHMAGVQVQRDDTVTTSTLVLRFPNTVNETLEGATAVELASGATPRGARLPSGCQLLVLAARRSARQQVRDAMQGHDLFVDYVPSVAAARDYCQESAPQVLVYESAFAGEALRGLCEMLNDQVPSVVLIELLPAGRQVEHASLGEAPVTRLGVEALRQQLAPVLVLAMEQRR